jgi:hypothetical protein
LDEHLRSLVRRLASLHVPLGRWAPMAASVLFAAGGLTHIKPLGALAYFGAICLVVLIGADILNSFIDQHAYPRHRPTILTLPMLCFRVLLTAVLGSFYSFLTFVGIGPFTPFGLWPLLFLICCAIAWRNVDLWYEEGAEFEQELAEEAQHQAPHLDSASQSRIR